CRYAFCAPCLSLFPSYGVHLNRHSFPTRRSSDLFTSQLTAIWKLINAYRKIGPAIVRDIALYTNESEDFVSAIILYVLPQFEGLDRKSTRLNSSHVSISYAVFCLKKKKKTHQPED